MADLGATYSFDLFGNSSTFRVNVNNLFDTYYIAESNTNIHAGDASETWNGVDTRNSHSIQFKSDDRPIIVK